jgi:hypothetical protein
VIRKLTEPFERERETSVAGDPGTILRGEAPLIDRYRHKHRVWTRPLGPFIVSAEQMTVRGHPDRACGNSAHPKTRPVGLQDHILSRADVSRTHPHP